MRFVLISFAVIIALIGVIWIIGLALPATRQGQAQGSIAAPPAAILAVIRAVEEQPSWRGDVASVTRTMTGWTETTARGQVIAFIPDVMTQDLIRLRFTSNAGFSGTWQAQLRAEGDKTHITLEERVTIPAPFGRILSRLFFNPEHFATTYLAELKTRVETMP